MGSGFRVLMVLLVSASLASSGAACRKGGKSTAGSAQVRTTAPASTWSASELLPERTIADATFLKLDFAAFPKLPAWQVPARGVVTVGKSGADHPTIGAALRAAAPGAVVVVAGGEYREQDSDCAECGLVARKPVTLMARAGQEVVIRPQGSAHTGLTVAASDVSVRGVTLRGFGALGVVWDGPVKRTVLADLHVDGSDEGIATMASKLDGLLAFNVTVTGAKTIGFHCGEGPCRNWRLENVTIDLSGGGSGSGADAFAIESGDNFLLVNVTATGASADGIDVKGKRVVVYGCHVHHVQRNGIKLWQGGDIINTLVHHTGADAALVTEQGRVRVLHSVFGFHNYHGDASYFVTLGYDARGVTEAELVNSIFFNASGAIWVDPGAKLSVRGCIFWGNDNGRVLEHGDHVVELRGGAGQFAKWGYGTGVLADPMLDARMMPQPNSPARDGGVKLSAAAPATDRRGQPRVRGSAPDVGAFEVQ